LLEKCLVRRINVAGAGDCFPSVYLSGFVVEGKASKTIDEHWEKDKAIYQI
jgi:hypothetical protein